MHENEQNCEVCQQEEAKSPSLKINGTKILERVILPSNECWMCDLKFDNSASQVNHFSNYHECDLCEYLLTFFNDSSERRKHYSERHNINLCEFCPKIFQTEVRRRMHTLAKHFSQKLSKMLRRGQAEIPENASNTTS